MVDKRSVRVRISGEVQGVGYRAWTVRRASALGLSGWVRNLPDGDVEAVFSGPAESVAEMIVACREGPRMSTVRAVEEVEAVEPVSGRFEVR
ncbi:acylphosphatase [Parvibaculum indicum]|uniref:acylphosphatase n=1 Tax=Parvibaculum indicum TaxID=562969 RepID=UPI00141E4601|nr:acylphosphatase [Parvibaculum indicum]NIJ40022.1 acylphosphatase [Parvibaculum indicum]